jgi:uncharacterized membrane protein YdbT with pleckstrin-like domain
MQLQQNENLIRKERIHAGIFVPPFLLFGFVLVSEILLFMFLSSMTRALSGRVTLLPMVLAFAFTMVPVLFVMAAAWLCYAKSGMMLTTRRLVYRTGFLVRASGELPLENIEAIIILEPLLGRLCGYGTVAVSSVGGLQCPMPYIGKPHLFHSRLQQAVSEAKAAGRPSLMKRPLPSADDSRYMPGS